MSFLTDETLFAGTLNDSDVIHLVDVSDTKQNAAGSSYKLTIGQLKTAIPTIYSADGTLSGARTVTQAGYALNFVGGNVGIGTTVSSFKLGVETQTNGDGIALTFNNTVLGGIQKSNVGVNGYLGLYENGTHPIVVLGKQAHTTDSIINDGKNLLIGAITAIAKAKLHVVGVDATSSNYAFKATDSAGNPLFYVRNDGVVGMPTLPTYADNALALVGGLVAGDIYKTVTGELRIVV